MTYTKPAIIYVKPLVISACKNGTCNGKDNSINDGAVMILNLPSETEAAAA